MRECANNSEYVSKNKWKGHKFDSDDHKYCRLHKRTFLTQIDHKYNNMT